MVKSLTIEVTVLFWRIGPKFLFWSLRSCCQAVLAPDHHQNKYFRVVSLGSLGYAKCQKRQCVVLKFVAVRFALDLSLASSWIYAKNMQLLLRTQILRIRNIALRKQNMKWEKKNNNRWANWKKKGTFFWKTEFQLGSLGFLWKVIQEKVRSPARFSLRWYFKG